MESLAKSLMRLSALVIFGLGTAFLAGCTQMPEGCEQQYITVYQPPVTQGGAGSVQRIAAGTYCEPQRRFIPIDPSERIEKEEPPNPEELVKVPLEVHEG